MKYEEVAPHLNKFARLHLKNNKRKVCWLYIDSYDQVSDNPPKEVCCVNVHLGRRFIHLNKMTETCDLKPFAESIPIEDIIHIRSSK